MSDDPDNTDGDWTHDEETDKRPGDDEFDFEDYAERKGLHTTDHPRVWSTHEEVHENAYDAATSLADEFEEYRIVSTESRIATQDVRWQAFHDDKVIVCEFYPIRANHWTSEIIDEIRAHLKEWEDENDE